MIIRDKKSSDIESLAEVHYQSWISAYEGMIPDDYIERHHKFNAPCLVAEVDDSIVGFLMYSKDKDSDVGNYCGEIMVIYLLKEFQNKGVGSKLMEEAEQRMRGDFEQLSVFGYLKIINKQLNFTKDLDLRLMEFMK
ncbi:GNAT family N-acetyltransferase [Mammaliicoccus stepanovicii]|uniref:Acetyltransferase n=1 Tax=Mammaliicoccus stepanovicii TaxID=643214 RepID=A0A239YC01_9STAP|nr:GNAT family N-acetyltransferase [Mammaliicoccus stepanovicii]GGI42543.1 hypothetical protein GCM10010896_18940 [Mammaliicoccus stepanovicii]SNV56230.1 acetyltransferase [Mammaliicoccus stepanovicii]